ncbi:hypothetical protein MVEN_01141000 [Mycena venus]|uniref:Mug135-like C-terminal domain-containing protein n=1 Tax=Mycena venus TaxID=2733690 RepID=A0A8H6Y9W4_9AGAR|nr:hypothetical protein MVEN_01141000 [Mycena venus]
MAVPLAQVLAQINFNIPPALIQNDGSVAGLMPPQAPANPPNIVDVSNAVKFKGAIVHELVLGKPVPHALVEAAANYECDTIMARQIAQAPQPAPPGAAVAPPAPAAPMAGVALILNAIATSNQALNRRLDMLNTRLDGLQRETAINGNIGKGTGLHIPYTEVLFLDGSQPTVATAAVPAQGGQPAQPGHPILPLLSNVNAIRNLSGPDARHYCIGYGIAPIPHIVQERLVLIAEAIGCVIGIAWYVPGSSHNFWYTDILAQNRA